MGNTICFQQGSSASNPVKLIFWEGKTRVLKGRKHVAGEIMFEFPDKMVCHSDSFFIGHPIPILAIDDELMPGHTYFVLPLDRFACNNSILSASSLSALDSSICPNSRSPVKFGEHCPFEYLKGSNGRVLIKVMPEFITTLITRGNKENIIGQYSSNYEIRSKSNSNGILCTTPELQKHYEQLVRYSKEQVWSPELETISEYKIIFSPCRFLGLVWKQKEK